MFLFVISFEMTVGPLLWVYMSEIMTEKGLGLGAFINQVILIGIAFIAPNFLNIKDAGYVFIGCSVFACI